MPPGARGCDQEALELPQVLTDLHSPQEIQPEGGSRQGPQGLSCLGGCLALPDLPHHWSASWMPSAKLAWLYPWVYPRVCPQVCPPVYPWVYSTSLRTEEL